LASTFRNTIFEVNLNAISHNYTFFKNKLNPKTKIMAVVKAFAYGHGAVAVSKHLEEIGIDYLAVAFIDEGVEIYQSGVQLPILIFNPNPEEFEAIVKNKLEPTVYNLAFLNDFLVYLAKNNIKSYPIHIKLDTGMHRSGFMTSDLEELKIIINTDLISIKSIYSHLAASEDLTENAFTQQQIVLFKKNAAYISTTLVQKPLFHILNSSGIIHYPEAQLDMVRLGISLYGSSSLKNIQKKLQAVGALKAVITQIRTIEKGETVSYNRKFKATKRTVIATVPIGYADGINRYLGNGNGTVLVNGSLVPIVGTICMDSLMLDITTVEVQIGDVVLFFGRKHSVQQLANVLNTISYEIFTNVSKRVKRVYTK
jgi:alanine racemase